MGWGQEPEPEYVVHYNAQPERAERLIAGADVVIAGSAPEALVRGCIRRNQLVFRYSERPLKNGPELKKYLPRLIKWHWRNPPWKKIHLLCASAYTAEDYARFGLFRGKAYRWGYFPEVKRYADIEKLLADKQKASILWVGRLLDWKHPDDAVAMAAALKAEGYPFDLKLIGTGPLEQPLREMIAAKGLSDCVHLLGSMTPERVRWHMEESSIFLFTSDRKEGWGAVLNEAMNSGCAVVASDAAGATAYLVQDGKNGLIYRACDVDELYETVRKLLEDPLLVRQLGSEAYRAMTELWNAENAAQRLVELIGQLLDSVETPQLYETGPCSKA